MNREQVLAEIEKAQKATPGPWRVVDHDGRKNIGVESASVEPTDMPGYCELAAKRLSQEILALEEGAQIEAPGFPAGARV